MKFPIGIVVFVCLVALGSVAGTFTTVFLWYRWADFDIGRWKIDSFNEALVLIPIGIVVALLMPHLTNVAARSLGSISVPILATEQAVNSRSPITPH